jgi:beta-galactosidase/beta-glucuronidase
VGKQKQWYKREPPNSVAKTFEVEVPSCWQKHVPNFGGGIGWYFKEVHLPSDLKGRVLRLKFWAVDYFAEVWVNGEKTGNHEGGYRVCVITLVLGTADDE